MTRSPDVGAPVDLLGDDPDDRFRIKVFRIGEALAPVVCPAAGLTVQSIL